MSKTRAIRVHEPQRTRLIIRDGSERDGAKARGAEEQWKRQGDNEMRGGRGKDPEEMVYNTRVVEKGTDREGRRPRTVI